MTDLPGQDDADAPLPPVVGKFARVASRIGALIFGVFWMSVVSGFAAFMLGGAWREIRKPLFYASVPAVVTAHTPAATTTDEFGEEESRAGTIEYSYRYEGTEHPGTHEQTGGLPGDTYSPALLRPFRPGETLDAWCDPDDPAEATLVPVADPKILAGIIFLIPFVAAGVGTLRYAVTGKGPVPQFRRGSGASRRGMSIQAGGRNMGILMAVSIPSMLVFLGLTFVAPWQAAWVIGIAMLVVVIPAVTVWINRRLAARAARKAKEPSAPAPAKQAAPAVVREQGEAPQIKPIGKKVLAFAAISVFWCGITGVFLGVALYSFVKHRDASRRFLSTEGEVIASKVKEHPGDSDSGPTYSPLINYRYNVAGRQYTSNRYAYGMGSTSSHGHIAGIVAEHPKGRRITVHYDPDDPAEAVLRLEIPAISYFLLLFLQPFIVIGVGLIVYTVSIPFAYARDKALLASRSPLASSIPGWGDVRPEAGGWSIRGGTSALGRLRAFAMGYGLTCFLSIFAVVIVGMVVYHKSPEEISPNVVWTVLAIAAGVGMLALLNSFRKSARKARFAIDVQFGRLSLTSGRRDVQLDFDRIDRWFVRIIRDPGGMSVNDVPCTRPLLGLTTTDGQEEPIHVFGIRASAVNVAEKVGRALAEMSGRPFGPVPEDESDQPPQTPTNLPDVLRQTISQGRRLRRAQKTYRDIM